MNKLILVLLTLTACQGKTGNQGQPASTTPVLVVQAPPGQCPTGGSMVFIGDTSFSVCNGANGATGQSIVGPQGSPGTDATQVAIVQLCPGTPSYPATFPEVAVCISNQLYAVYSTNGGFLALLTPGLYSSSAVGSSCTFTVSADCQVSQ